MWIISKEELVIAAIVLAVGLVALFLVLVPAKHETSVATSPSMPSQTVAQAPPSTPAPAAAVVSSPAPVTAPATVVAAQPTPNVYVQEVAPATPVAPPVPPVVAIDGVIYAGEYAHDTEASGFEIHWSNDARTLRVGLVSPGTGYVAIGFDPESGMRGANFILGAVRDGRLWTRDDYGNDFLSHAADTALGGSDNVLEAAGTERDGKTCFEFVIPLNSGDPLDKPLVPGNTYSIVIAFHETNDDFDAYHSRRGAGSLRLDLPG